MGSFHRNQRSTQLLLHEKKKMVVQEMNGLLATVTAFVVMVATTVLIRIGGLRKLRASWFWILCAHISRSTFVSIFARHYGHSRLSHHGHPHCQRHQQHRPHALHFSCILIYFIEDETMMSSPC